MSLTRRRVDVVPDLHFPVHILTPEAAPCVWCSRSAPLNEAGTDRASMEGFAQRSACPPPPPRSSACSSSWPVYALSCGVRARILPSYRTPARNISGDLCVPAATERRRHRGRRHAARRHGLRGARSETARGGAVQPPAPPSASGPSWPPSIARPWPTLTALQIGGGMHPGGGARPGDGRCAGALPERPRVEAAPRVLLLFGPQPVGESLSLAVCASRDGSGRRA